MTCRGEHPVQHFGVMRQCGGGGECGRGAGERGGGAGRGRHPRRVQLGGADAQRQLPHARLLLLRYAAKLVL